MPLGYFVFIAWMVFMAVLVAVAIAWGARRGQFRNIEEPKYRMLEDREPEPWPGRENFPAPGGARPANPDGGNDGSKRT